MPKMTGAKYLAGTLKAYGVTHVFFVPATLRRSLAETSNRWEDSRPA